MAEDERAKTHIAPVVGITEKAVDHDEHVENPDRQLAFERVLARRKGGVIGRHAVVEAPSAGARRERRTPTHISGFIPRRCKPIR